MRPITAYLVVVPLRDMSGMFIAVTYARFLQQIGLTNSQITIINWSFAALMLLAQIPTGIFADRYGRARSMKIGMTILTVGLFAYYWASGFWSAIALEGLLGVGVAFVCGADQAWITAELNRQNRNEEIEKIFSTAQMICAVGALSAGFIGGLLGARDLRWPWLACGSLSLLALILACLFMPDPIRGSENPTKRGPSLTRQSWKMFAGSRALKWAVALPCVMALTIPYCHYQSLVFKSLASGTALAWIWLPQFAPQLIGAYVMLRWRGKLANGIGLMALAMTPFVGGSAMICLGLAPCLIGKLSGAMSLELTYGFQHPLLSAFVQRRVGEEYRATYGSLQALIIGIWTTILSIGVATTMAARANGVPAICQLWWQMGALMLIGAVALFLWRPRAINDPS